MTYETLMENEDQPFLFDCPHCGSEQEAHVFVDRRDCGSGVTWIVCSRCYGPAYDGGMWDVGDVMDRIQLA